MVKKANREGTEQNPGNGDVVYAVQTTRSAVATKLHWNGYRATEVIDIVDPAKHIAANNHIYILEGSVPVEELVKNPPKEMKEKWILTEKDLGFISVPDTKKITKIKQERLAVKSAEEAKLKIKNRPQK